MAHTHKINVSLGISTTHSYLKTKVAVLFLSVVSLTIIVDDDNLGLIWDKINRGVISCELSQKHFIVFHNVIAEYWYVDTLLFTSVPLITLELEFQYRQLCKNFRIVHTSCRRENVNLCVYLENNYKVAYTYCSLASGSESDSHISIKFSKDFYAHFYDISITIVIVLLHWIHILTEPNCNICKKKDQQKWLWLTLTGIHYKLQWLKELPRSRLKSLCVGLGKLHMYTLPLYSITS